MSPLALSAGQIVLTTSLSLNPSDTALPGGTVIQQFANGIGWWGLVAALVGLVVGAATWALGAHTNNYQHASSGRRAVLVSGAAALVIGAAPPVLNFLFTSGQSVH
jgi:hypothetical protein